nr:MAG TPA: hypothetical protein [Caudoviricetes sp.]
MYSTTRRSSGCKADNGLLYRNRISFPRSE